MNDEHHDGENDEDHDRFGHRWCPTQRSCGGVKGQGCKRPKGECVGN